MGDDGRDPLERERTLIYEMIDAINRLTGLMEGLVQEIAPILGVEGMKRMAEAADRKIAEGQKGRKGGN